MHVDDEGEMSPKIKSVEYLAVGAGTVFDPPTNDLIYILYMQNVFLCVSGEFTMNTRMVRSRHSATKDAEVRQSQILYPLLHWWEDGPRCQH